MVMGRRARIPRRSEKFSSNPPTTAPSTLAPRAAPGAASVRNSNENNNPAKMTGTEKTTATSVPTNAGGPGIRAKGSQYATSNPMNNGKTIQILGNVFGK